MLGGAPCDRAHFSDDLEPPVLLDSGVAQRSEVYPASACRFSLGHCVLHLVILCISFLSYTLLLPFISAYIIRLLASIGLIVFASVYVHSLPRSCSIEWIELKMYVFPKMT